MNIDQDVYIEYLENSPQIHAAAYKTSDIVALGWPVRRYEFSSSKAHCWTAYFRIACTRIATSSN